MINIKEKGMVSIITLTKRDYYIPLKFTHNNFIFRNGMLPALCFSCTSSSPFPASRSNFSLRQDQSSNYCKNSTCPLERYIIPLFQRHLNYVPYFSYPMALNSLALSEILAYKLRGLHNISI